MGIFIGCWPWSIKGHTQMASNPRRITSADFYCIKQIDNIFPCMCTVIDHRRRHSVQRTTVTTLDCVSCCTFCSLHAVTTFVIYYSIHTRKNVIYLFIILRSTANFPGVSKINSFPAMKWKNLRQFSCFNEQVSIHWEFQVNLIVLELLTLKVRIG